MSRLLIHENPLMVLPSLAIKIGLNEAIVLQQIHYWLNPLINKNYKEEKYWIYNTYSGWQKQFPFWSEITIKRTINNLEKSLILISKNFNKSNFDKTKWYTINYIELNKLNNIKITRIDQNDLIDNEISNSRDDQFDTLVDNPGSDPQINLIRSNMYTKTTTEITNNSLSQQNDDEREREMIKIWNEKVGRNQEVVKLTPQRKQILSKIIEQHFNNNLNEWSDYCYKITTSKFLMGEITAFKANLDWALKEENIIKIIENSYRIGDRVVFNELPTETNSQELIAEIHSSNDPKFWKEIKEALLREFGKETYISWFRKIEIGNFTNELLEIKAFSNFACQYLQQHYETKIKEICNQFMSELKYLKIIHLK